MTLHDDSAASALAARIVSMERDGQDASALYAEWRAMVEAPKPPPVRLAWVAPAIERSQGVGWPL